MVAGRPARLVVEEPLHSQGEGFTACVPAVHRRFLPLIRVRSVAAVANSRTMAAAISGKRRGWHAVGLAGQVMMTTAGVSPASTSSIRIAAEGHSRGQLGLDNVKLDPITSCRWDTLARKRRVLGEDHPDTVITASNLAPIARGALSPLRARQRHGPNSTFGRSIARLSPLICP
jgi:hypothetical protein